MKHKYYIKIEARIIVIFITNICNILKKIEASKT